MQEIPTKALVRLGLAMALGLSLAGAVKSAQVRDHGAALHGGKVTMTKAYHFEVVVAKNGLRVYPRTHEDKPIDAAGLSGTATFYHGSSPTPWFRCKLTAPTAPKGGEQGSIGASIDLSKLPASGVKVDFRIEGFPEPGATTASFSMPVSLASSSEIVVAKSARSDRKAIESQKTCPVSKEDLLSMGVPIKVSRGDKSVFLCCPECLKTVKADPDKFLGKMTGSETTKRK